MRAIAFTIVLIMGVCPSFGMTPTEHSERVLSTLIKAHGEDRNDYPTIKVIKRQKNIAAYSHKQNLIIIEQKAYDLCQEMGEYADDALAFLISHELTHFFQIKEWSQGSETMAFYDETEAYEKHKQKEAEADMYGAFLCYRAYYNYYEVAPKIIAKLYHSYELDQKGNKKYPSVVERKKLSTQVCAMVKQYSLIYECANNLHLLGEYDLAQSAYQYLLKYLDLSELYHNSGTNQLLAALSIKTDKKPYPIDIIYALNLRSALSKHPKLLIEQAIQNLTKAAQKNSSEHESFINLIIAHIEKDEIIEAQEIIQDLKKLKLKPFILEKLAQIEAIVSGNWNSTILNPQQMSKEESELPFPTSHKGLEGQPNVVIDDSDPIFPLIFKYDEQDDITCSISNSNKEVTFIFQNLDKKTINTIRELEITQSSNVFLIQNPHSQLTKALIKIEVK